MLEKEEPPILLLMSVVCGWRLSTSCLESLPGETVKLENFNTGKSSLITVNVYCTCTCSECELVHAYYMYVGG